MARSGASLERAFAANALARVGFVALAGVRLVSGALAGVGLVSGALARVGFVERSVSTVDTRAVELTLTDQGIATVREAMPLVARLRDELSKPLGGINGERTRQLTEMLVELLDVPELHR